MFRYGGGRDGGSSRGIYLQKEQSTISGFKVKRALEVRVMSFVLARNTFLYHLRARELERRGRWHLPVRALANSLTNPTGEAVIGEQAIRMVLVSTTLANTSFSFSLTRTASPPALVRLHVAGVLDGGLLGPRVMVGEA